MSDLPLTTDQLQILNIPAGPFLPLLRTELTDIAVHEAALALSEQLRHAFPQAGPLVVLGEGADLTALDDDDLARLGLIRRDDEAAGRVRAFIAAFAGRRGLDPEEVYGLDGGIAAGGTSLLVSDLRALLGPDTPDTPVDEIPPGERQPE